MCDNQSWDQNFKFILYIDTFLDPYSEWAINIGEGRPFVPHQEHCIIRVRSMSIEVPRVWKESGRMS